MIIDGHVHLTEPIEMLIEKMTQVQIDRAVICCSGMARGEEIVDLASAENVMAEFIRLKSAGCDSTWVRAQNEKLARAAASFPDKIWAFGKLDLSLSIDQCMAEMEFCFDRKFKGFGEIVNFAGWWEKLGLILAKSQSFGGMPIFFHCDSPVTKSELIRLCELAQEYSGTPVIVGHMGGDYWQEAVKAAKFVSNVYVDCSEVANLVALRVAAVEAPQKVIFSSDFPWEDPAVSLTRLECLELSEKVKESILAKTLLQLL
ncbi:MAG: amidohydrolase family protein [Bacillota bacterium]